MDVENPFFKEQEACLRNCHKIVFTVMDSMTSDEIMRLWDSDHDLVEEYIMAIARTEHVYEPNRRAYSKN